MFGKGQIDLVIFYKYTVGVSGTLLIWLHFHLSDYRIVSKMPFAHRTILSCGKFMVIVGIAQNGRFYDN